ncbi:MAG: amidophosphoribosyltransferase [Myxococcota bacterium]
MCGFVGVIGDEHVATSAVLSLQAIQHRGQDAAGLGVWNDRRVSIQKGLGLISQAVPASRVAAFEGSVAIGHVRYPTAGAESTAEDAQPFRSRWPGVLLAHNGNLTNVPELKHWLREQGVVVLSECDAEPLLLTFTRALNRERPAGHTREDVIGAVREVYARVKGAYSTVIALEVDGEPTLVSFRDPHGIRPGVYGQRDDGAWFVASESVALDVHGVVKTDDLPVGEVLFLRANQPAMKVSVQKNERRHCIFERIYFARADSHMEDGRINRSRFRFGRRLAQEWAARGFEIDLVVAVPDTSRPAAMAIAEELGVPHREGFIKNRYSGRTFIMPNQAARDAALRLKLNPIPEMFRGKRVLLVDDSVVRGSTMRRIVQMLRQLEPEAIHLGIFSPPVRNPCFYGIDMPTREELVAASYDQDRLEAVLNERFGTDSVTYLSLEGLRETAEVPMCDACFSGDYVIPVTDSERAYIQGERRQ